MRTLVEALLNDIIASTLQQYAVRYLVHHLLGDTKASNVTTASFFWLPWNPVSCKHLRVPV